MQRAVLGGLVLLWASVLSAQEQQQNTLIPPGMQQQEDGAGTKKWCDIYFSDTGGKDVIVLDQNGNYMPDVREVYLWIRVANSVPAVRLYLWKGIYRPSNVRSELWSVRNVKIITAAEFQKLVDRYETGGGNG